MKAGGRKKLAAVIACAGSLLLAFTSALSPMTFIAYAAAPSEFDKTAIEEDLKVFELEGYPKNEKEKHRLLEGGFMEYAYSENAELSGKYYGVYFYVYNPTEREVSERAGAHTVNMAVAYDAAGKPSDYDNLALTLLDETENHRFLKFKLTDGAGAYVRAKAYAQAHGGERRYDVAGVQLWFAGDQNATDSNTGTEISFTYYCTGYAAGCGQYPEAASTYECRLEKLETVRLDVEQTFYRTESSSLGKGHQNQVNTVYFTVPQELFDEYGRLQRIKAEWYEFRTRPIFVTSSEEFYNAISPHIGVQLPHQIGHLYFDTSIKYSFGVGEMGFGKFIPTGLNWNFRNAASREDEVMQTLNYIFYTNGVSIDSYDPASDIVSTGGILSDKLTEYIMTYDRSQNSGVLNLGEKQLSGDLFESDIDANRKLNNERGKIQRGHEGKSYYDFDIDQDIQIIETWKDTQPSWWDNFLQFGLGAAIFGQIPTDTGKSFPPIKVIASGDLDGTAHEAAERLLVNEAEIKMLRNKVANIGEDKLVLFRFATTDYYSENAVVCKSDIVTEHHQNEAYIAQESVFLNFDVIQLTFKRGEEVKVIPVVSNPIDVISPITPKPVYTNGLPWWIWCTVAGGVLVLALIITLSAEKEAKK